jgi:hypothetical protein
MINKQNIAQHRKLLSSSYVGSLNVPPKLPSVLSSRSIIYAYTHIHYPLSFMASMFDLCLFVSD